MAKNSRNGVDGESTGGERVTSLETANRLRARGLIDAIVEEELDAALGAALSTRVGDGRHVGGHVRSRKSGRRSSRRSSLGSSFWFRLRGKTRAVHALFCAGLGDGDRVGWAS